MASLVYKLGPDAYVEWSTASDAPESYVMGRAAMARRLLSQSARRHPREAALERMVRQSVEERIARADERGSSLYGAALGTPEDLVASNRAGPNGEHLTLAAILERFASKESMRTFEVTPDKVAPEKR